MPSRNEPNEPPHSSATLRAEHEALVARARELISDPGYPTAAIVEELAEWLILHGAQPDGQH
ncbi:MAG TPA: hypothetical protein VIK52_02530 [Opitutaceae bacterium]